MKSMLIKDTTKEEQEALIKSSLFSGMQVDGQGV